MLVCRAASDAQTVLLLGLSQQNTIRLVAGQPIRLTRETHGMAIPEGITIVLVYGPTEEAIEAELRLHGLIGPTTVMNQMDPA